MAARLAIARAQRQLSIEADIHLVTRNFSIINEVGAVSLQATLECNEFANAHTTDAHFDSSSFVGLAWRPTGESICCEIYSSGRANLPGSTKERDMIASWARMLPELLRFSSRSRMLESIPEELKCVHRTSYTPLARAMPNQPQEHNLMDGWTRSAEFDEPLAPQDADADFELDDSALDALGL